MRGADGLAQRPAGVGVESARAVEREERARVARRQGIRRPDQPGVGFLDRAREADAEQAVDDHRPADVLRHIRMGCSACGGEAPISRGCVGRQTVFGADENDVCFELPITQKTRHFEGIAAIVARPGKHEDRRIAPGADEAGQVGCSAPGALHQRLIGRCRLGAAQRGGTKERSGGDGPIQRKRAGRPFKHEAGVGAPSAPAGGVGSRL